MYIFKFFIPIKLSAFYPYPELVTSGNIPTEYYLGFIIWPLTAGAIYIGYRFYQPLLFGILFYFITIGLVLQFISVGSAIMADRYSYLPYLGLAYPIAHFLYDLYQKKATLKTPVYATTAAFFIFLSISTYARTQVWKDNISLWSDVINKYPTVEVAYKNRGNYYGKELGKVDEAYKDYMVLKRMNSKDTKVYSNMGNVYGMRQQPDSAIWCYNKAIALDPNNEEAYINRGITYSMMKQFANAINDFNSAEKIKGLSLSILQNRAYTLLAAGRYSESAKDYQELIRLKPNDALTYYYSALAQEGSGNIALSKQHLQQAISLGYQVDEATRTRIIQK
jgi:tetratricopeptide (TPR) repeat protein